MRSYGRLQGQSQEVVLRYIRIFWDALDSSKKRKLNGVRYEGSYVGHWEKSKGNGTR